MGKYNIISITTVTTEGYNYLKFFAFSVTVVQQKRIIFSNASNLSRRAGILKNLPNTMFCKMSHREGI